MKKNKILFYIVIFMMLVGGIMGIVKGLVPNMTWFNFRHLLGLGGTFENESIRTYGVLYRISVLYGIQMAMLEIISSILLLINKRIGIKFAMITLSINALVCFIAILIGDIMAIGSLLIRFVGIYILIKAKQFIS